MLDGWKVERSGIESAELDQFARTKPLRQKLFAQRQAGSVPLLMGGRPQPGKRDLDRGEIALASAPISRGAANVVENAGSDGLAIGDREQHQDARLGAVDRNFAAAAQRRGRSRRAPVLPR